eukprot:46527-Amphidinium_carterae.2
MRQSQKRAATGTNTQLQVSERPAGSLVSIPASLTHRLNCLSMWSNCKPSLVDELTLLRTHDDDDDDDDDYDDDDDAGRQSICIQLLGILTGHGRTHRIQGSCKLLLCTLWCKGLDLLVMSLVLT